MFYDFLIIGEKEYIDNWAKDFTRQMIQEIKLDNKHMKRCSISLIIIDMQMKQNNIKFQTSSMLKSIIMYDTTRCLHAYQSNMCSL